jgi:hypothetical protein
MFKRKTLFVLGAGASFEANLPLGVRLAKIIRDKMDIRFDQERRIGGGDYDLFSQIIYRNPNERERYFLACQRIKAGLGFAQSIDDFLDQRRTDQDINHYGKAAIVRTILQSEMGSNLYPQQETEGLDPDRFANSWFAKFIYMLGKGVPREDVDLIFQNVSFINFNYDRCLEHFLRDALKKLYSLRQQDAERVVSTLRVRRPYGSIGPLEEVPFGASRADYDQLAKNIITYTEATTENAVADLKLEFTVAECVVFLGFAYHSQNMNLLKPPGRIRPKPIFGTAKGLSDSDVNIVHNQLFRFFDSSETVDLRHAKIKLENELTCSDLFDHYTKSLSGD